MNISELFIRRPVATTLVMLGILFFGIVGYRLLPVSDLPNVDFPTIQVTASMPGASPETMASAIATPLERQFTTIAGRQHELHERPGVRDPWFSRAGLDCRPGRQAAIARPAAPRHTRPPPPVIRGPTVL
jgi:hypothetical protein